MNKFITKIVGAALGLTLAIGVGVAVGSNQGDSRKVDAAAGDSYRLVKSVNDLAAGDEVLFGYTNGSDVHKASGQLNANTGSYLRAIDVTISNEVLTYTGNTVKPLILSKSGNNWVFTYDTTTVATTAVKKMCISTTNNSVSTWTISIANTGVATITSTTASYGTIKYNSNDPRFLNYASGQQNIGIYKKTAPVASISFNPTSLSLKTGQSPTTVTATVKNLGTDVAYEWSIKDGSATNLVSLSNTDTATVTVSVIAASAGSTIIQCYALGSDDEVTGYVNVSVALAPTSVTFDGTEPAASTYTLETYDSYSYKNMPGVTVNPSGASQDVVYTILTGNDLVSLNDNKTRINILKKVESTETATIKIEAASDSSVYATLTVSVSHDAIKAIRVKPETTIPNQVIGEKFNPSGIQFQKQHNQNTTWVNFESGDSVTCETIIEESTESVTVYLTGSDTISCVVTGFNVVDYAGTYKVTSNKSDTFINATTSNFKTYTDNSDPFTVKTVTNVKFGANPAQGECGKNTDIVLDQNGVLTLDAPSTYVVSRIELNVSTKANKNGGKSDLTVGGYTYSLTSYSSRSLIVEYPFTNSITVSVTYWVFIEYIEITLTPASNTSAMALAYGLAFNELTHEECAAMGGISADTWEYVEDYYDAAVLANAGLEGTLKTAEANKAGDNLGQAMFRYDMIKTKYSKTDFLGRFGVGGINAAVNINKGSINSNNGTTTLVIILIASISLVAVSGYFVIRRRREN